MAGGGSNNIKRGLLKRGKFPYPSQAGLMAFPPVTEYEIWLMNKNIIREE
jgi:hypothetical protein